MTTIARIHDDALSILGELHEDAVLPARFDSSGDLDAPKLLEDGISPVRHGTLETACSEFIEGRLWTPPPAQYIYIGINPLNVGKVVKVSPSPLCKITTLTLPAGITAGPRHWAKVGDYAYGSPAQGANNKWMELDLIHFVISDSGTEAYFIVWTEVIGGVPYFRGSVSTPTYIYPKGIVAVGGPYTDYYSGGMYYIGGKLYLVGTGSTSGAKIGVMTPPSWAMGTETVLTGDISLSGEAMDDRYFYLAFGTNPGKLVRFDYLSMTKIDTVTCPHAGYYFYGIAVSGDYLYLTTNVVNNYPRIYKYNKTDLSYVSHANLGAYANQYSYLAKIVIYEEYGYALSNGTPLKVIQINLQTLAVVASIRLAPEETGFIGGFDLL